MISPEHDNSFPGLNRRTFLQGIGAGLPLAAVHLAAAGELGVRQEYHHRPTAKRVLVLTQSGAPSQVDLFDHKPTLNKMHGAELPESIRRGQRLTTMTASQKEKPLIGSPFAFQRHGQSGIELSELLPHLSKVADRLCLVRAMHTDAINHDPAITFLQTGGQQAGRPSMGAWVSYGLARENRDLPDYIVFLSGGLPGDQPLYTRLWGSGFLPSQHQGVQLRSERDPVLFLSDPAGIDRPLRNRMVERVSRLNQMRYDATRDPRILNRIRQQEMAFRMQDSLPAAVDTADEPEHTFELYGPDSRHPGTFASNCLLARRLLERDVRFVQLYHRGWDHHANLESRIAGKCQETDQPSAALVHDLAQRGLLEDTIVVWAGEFGRTAFCQGELEAKDYGRDHHPRCFSIWLAGGGIKSGFTYGETDEFSYNIESGGVHVWDLHATLLHCLGIDHTRLTFRYQGRDHRLTDVGGEVVTEILA